MLIRKVNIIYKLFNLKRMSERKKNLKERKWLWVGGMVTDFDHFIVCVLKS